MRSEPWPERLGLVSRLAVLLRGPAPRVGVAQLEPDADGRRGRPNVALPSTAADERVGVDGVAYVEYRKRDDGEPDRLPAVMIQKTNKQLFS